MKTRNLLVSGLALALFALAILLAGRAAALQKSVSPAEDGNSIENVAAPVHAVKIINQVFYSPTVEEFVNYGRTTKITDQVFYSPTVEEFVNYGRTPKIENQIFYSPSIQEFLR